MTAGEFQHLWRPPTLQDLPFCSYKHWLTWLCAEDFCNLTFRFWRSHCVLNHFESCWPFQHLQSHFLHKLYFFRHTCFCHQLFRFTTFRWTGHFYDLSALQATEAWKTFAPRISESSEEQKRTWRQSNLSAGYLDSPDPKGWSVGAACRNTGSSSSLFIKLAGSGAWGGDYGHLWYLAKSTVVTGGYFIIVTVSVRYLRPCQLFQFLPAS